MKTKAMPHRVARPVFASTAKAERVGDGAGIRDYVAAEVARRGIIAREILGAGKHDESVAFLVRKLDEFRVYANAEDVTCCCKYTLEGVITAFFAGKTPTAPDASVGTEDEKRLDRAGMLDLAKTVAASISQCV